MAAATGQPARTPTPSRAGRLPFSGTQSLITPTLAAFLTPAPGIRPRHREFRGDPAQVRNARRFTRGYLDSCPSAADTALLTSELATNSILHSRSGHGGTFHVVIGHHCPGIIRVAIIDDGSITTPTLADPDPLDGNGRGLALVQDIAAQWGHEGDDSTRTVWFELRCG